jgi:hypothetical protein
MENAILTNLWNNLTPADRWRLAIWLVGFALMAVIAGILWYQRLGQIRKRNRATFPGAGNAHFLSPHSEASEAWVDARATLNAGAGRASRAIRGASAAMHGLACAFVAIVFGVATALPGEDLRFRSISIGITLLFSAGWPGLWERPPSKRSGPSAAATPTLR